MAPRFLRSPFSLRSSSRAAVLAAALCAVAWSEGGRAQELTAEERALHVLDRLAYGPRPGDLQRVIQIGPERYIAEQLDPAQIPIPDALKAKLASLPTYYLDEGRLFVQYGPPSFPPKSKGQDALKAARARARDITRDAHRARLWQAVESPRQLQEVMTEFWFNHFNVFEGKEWDRYWVANFERTAIRPHALGNFRELLGAVAHHPAMLYYLDNWLSSGADAPASRGRFKGLNENYARELLELHTMGVNGGYTQEDVIALARVLTGWTIDVAGMREGNRVAFKFAEKRHDFGDKVLLGKHIGASGVTEGERALDMLAAHPATARFISTKLVQYFIADKPNPELVQRLAQRFIETHGDSRAVLQALFQSPEFWARENYQAKFKTPYQYVVSTLRAADIPVLNTRPVEGVLAQLGMPLYGWPTPDGYKTTPDSWLNPDAMLRRINFATAIGSGRLPVSRPEPNADSALPAAELGRAGGVMPPDGAAPPAGAPLSEGALAPEGDPQAMRVAQEEDAQRVSAPAPDAVRRKGGGRAVTAPDAKALEATLGPALSPKTRAAADAAAPALRAAALLGSPDFMRR